MRKFKFKFSAHKDTLVEISILVFIIALAFFLRTYWAVGPAIQYGYSVSGGSDSYYHERIIFHILDSKHQLINDPMLNYPIGVNNPRPPLFHWAIVLSSYIFYPFMEIHNAALLMLILFPAIWGTLTIIPVYLIGKEAFSKKVGFLSALILATMPAHLMRSVATQADWDAFDLFFISLSFYFFLKALKTVNYKKWIHDWFKISDVKNGLTIFFKENKKAMLYAALSGTAMGSLALAWKGYTYAEAILLVYLFSQVFINRFRNKSNLHMVMLMLIFTIFTFGLASPWYIVTHRIGQWFDVPLFLMLFVLFIGIFLEVTGKYPWPFVFGSAGVGITIILVIVNAFFPDLWALIISGQGYFVKSKLYSTIAEAQPATMGSLAMSFGVALFILAFGGIIYLFYLIKKKREEYYLFFVFYSVIAVYMAISAARFIFNAAPAFALTSAIALVWLLDILKLKEAVKEFKGYQRGLKRSFKKVVKFSHIVGILFIAFIVILPNVWSAVDAGIPYETKKTFDKQIYNIMPNFIRPNKTTYKSSSPWYLGAFGYSIPKETYPWPRAWKWLSEQDNYSPPEDRPAFVSWWDYGFEAVREGKHPAIADNFQNGYQMAAQIITAQNESEVISLFIERVLDGEFKNGHLSERAMNILKNYLGADEASKIEDIMKEPSKYRDEVLNNPDRYGYYSSDISDVNTKYAAIKGILAYLPEEKLIKIYDDIRNATGKDIRYFAVDYRLFPFSGRNTGIFYAPAKLGDRRINQFGGTVVPYDFYNLKAVDSYGNEYEINKVPANVRIVNYKIEYQPMFYHCMLYRTFIGYSGSDIGQSDGIPGLSYNLQRYYPMQAWNLTHFKLVYRTAYWNPYKDYQNHSKDWKPIPVQLALKYQKEDKGTVDLNPPAYQVLPNDVVMVKFYEGAVIEGRVTLSTGEPLKHVRVTVLDEFNTPHASVFTDDNGYYKLDAVAGNLTLVVSTNGNLNKLRMIEKTILSQTKVNVSEEQAMRLKPDYFINKNIVVKPANFDGVVYFDVNGDNKVTSDDVKIANGYLILRNYTYGYENKTKIKNGNYEINDIPPHTYTVDLVLNGRKFPSIENVSFSSGQNLTKDISLKPSYIKGVVDYNNGTPASNATVELRGLYVNYVTHTDKNGNYSIMVVPDNYTVFSYLNDYYSEKGVVIVNLWNYTTEYNMTLRHAFKLWGVVKYNGERVKDAVIKIESELIPHNIYLKRSGNNGSFDLNIPAGIYSIYAMGYVNGERVVYFNVIKLNNDKSLNINLEKAYEVYGHIKSIKHISGIEISIFSGDKFYRGFGNFTGYYEVYLPRGKYSMGILAFDENNTPYFNREIFTLNGDRNIDIDLHKAYNVTGYVYFDKNGDGIREDNETIKNGLIILGDSNGDYEVRNIPPTGKFMLSTTINYKISTILFGYEQKNVFQNNVVVEPENVLVEGEIYRNGKLNNIPVNIAFKSGNYVKEVNNVISSYSVNLPPGNYTITMYGFNRTYKIQNNNLTVNIGFKKIEKDLNFVAFAHITVISEATSVNWYKNGKSVLYGKDINIPIGNYTIYAKNDTCSNITSLSIYGNETVEINIHPSYLVYVNIINYTGNVNVVLHSQDGIMDIGSSVFLPEGYYNFTVNFVKLLNGIYYDYYAYKSVYVNSNMSVNLNIQSKKLFTHIYGRVIYGNSFASNCILNMISMEKSKNNVSFSTNNEGYYSGFITPGRYLLYISYFYGNKLFSNVSEVNITSSTMNLNISLSNGYILSGGVYLNDEIQSALIKIRVYGGVIEINSEGYYSVVLPHGNYQISSETFREEYNLKVRYLFNKNINLTGNYHLDISLERESYHNLEINAISGDKIANPNGTVGILVDIKNKGNDLEKVKFEGINGWNVIKNKNTEIYPGEEKSISLVVKVPKNANSGSVEIHLRALYSGQTNDFYFKTNITKTYLTSLNSTLKGWNNNSLIYEISVENKGNTWMNYTIGTLNIMELKNKGWNVKLFVNGGERNYINVSAYSTNKFEVRIFALRNEPSTITPAIIFVEGEKTYTIELQLQYPHISSLLYVKGNNTQNYTGIEIPQYYYAVWAVAVGIGVSIVIIGRRRR